jgi:hypothetical protein
MKSKIIFNFRDSCLKNMIKVFSHPALINFSPEKPY